MKNKRKTTENSSVMAELRAIREKRNKELNEDPIGFFKRLRAFTKKYSEEHGVTFVDVD